MCLALSWALGQDRSLDSAAQRKLPLISFAMHRGRKEGMLPGCLIRIQEGPVGCGAERRF